MRPCWACKVRRKMGQFPFVMSSMLDLMPAPGLIYNEWDKHGT